MDNQNLMSKQTIPPLTSPPIEKSKEWFKILLIVIGFLIVLGLFGNIYLLLRKENQKPVVQITPTPTQTVFLPTSIPTQTALLPTPTIDPTANWKVYTEPQYGFSFKYEPSVTVNRNEYKSTYGGKEIVLTTKYDNKGFDWFVEENINGISLEDFSKGWTEGMATVYPNKTIGRTRGILAEFPGYKGSLDADYAHLEYYMTGTGNRLYRLRLYTNEMTVSDPDRQLFNTIIESIEFFLTRSFPPSNFSNS